MKSARYGIANLKRIMPELVNWTTTGQPGQTYEEAAKLYSGVIFQWGLYLYHVMANVGGIYLENTTVGDGEQTFTYVEKDRQKEAVQFLLEEIFTYPDWLFNAPITNYTLSAEGHSGRSGGAESEPGIQEPAELCVLGSAAQRASGAHD